MNFKNNFDKTKLIPIELDIIVDSPDKKMNEDITQNNYGVHKRGGIVRFAIFSGKHTMLLNRKSDPDDDSKITQDLVKQNPGWFKDSLKTRDSDAKWTKDYDSIGYHYSMGRKR